MAALEKCMGYFLLWQQQQGLQHWADCLTGNSPSPKWPVNGLDIETQCWGWSEGTLCARVLQPEGGVERECSVVQEPQLCYYSCSQSLCVSPQPSNSYSQSLLKFTSKTFSTPSPTRLYHLTCALFFVVSSKSWEEGGGFYECVCVVRGMRGSGGQQFAAVHLPVWPVYEAPPAASQLVLSCCHHPCVCSHSTGRNI